ncbi:hypothetical protein BaRGS_00018640, partial [Batillaria attramentaria]
MEGRGYRSVVCVILAVLVVCAHGQNQTPEEGCLQIASDSSKGSDSYARAESDVANGTARLESPWLCATGTNFTSLQFGYYMGSDSNRCQLSVLIRTRSGSARTDLTRQSHSGGSFNPLGPVYIGCSTNRFKIIFEAQKLTSGKCGTFANGIDIDEIVFGVVNVTPSSFESCPSPPTTEYPATTSTLVVTTQVTTFSRGNSDRPNGDEDGGLGGGAVAGIVVSVVVVAAFGVVIFLFLRRQRRQKSPNTSQKS